MLRNSEHVNNKGTEQTIKQLTNKHIKTYKNIKHICLTQKQKIKTLKNIRRKFFF